MTARVTSPRFVGRAGELATVVATLERAAAGDAVHLLVGGEAGVGKTRLAAEAARHAGELGFRVLRGQSVSVGEAGLPYGPLVEILRGVVLDVGGGEARAMAGRGAADLARLVPELGSGTSEVAAPAEWAQTRLFEAMLGLLRRLATRSPVLLVMEDIHWADAATREATTFLIGGLRGLPVLVLATFRVDELHRRHPLVPWLAELERRMPVQRLSLERFDREATADMARSILGSPVSGRLLDDLFERSGGNPFFAEALLASAEGGRLGPGLPPTLREVLLASVDRMPDPAIAVLSAAAVAGMTVEHGLLERIADLPEAALHDGIRDAVAAHLLLAETDGREDRYTFRHALVQEAVYEELLPAERRRLHRRTAEALEADGARGAAESSDARWRTAVAHHWALAREDDRAFVASLRAADSSIDAFAFGAALSAYETVLDLWDRVADPEARAGADRAEIERRAGLAGYLAGDYRRAVAHRRAAVAAVDAAIDPTRAGMLREQLARSLYVAGDAAGSLEAYEASVAVIPPSPPSPERARALSGLGQILMLLARYRDSKVLCEEAVAMAVALGDRVQEGHARNTLGIDLVMLGSCDEGLRSLREALRIAREAGVPDDVGRAYVNLGEALDACARTTEALDSALEGLELAGEIGVGFSYGYYIALGGVAFAYALGRWEVALQLLDEARSREPSGPGSAAYRISRTLPLLVGRGDWADADVVVEEAEALGDQDRGAQFTGPVHAATAELALWRGQPAAARDAVERGLRGLHVTQDRLETGRLCRLGAWAAADLHEQARVRQDTAGADQAEAWLAQLARRLGAVGEGAGSAAVLFEADRATFEAEAARLAGRAEPGRWRDVADAWEAAERPYLAAYARWREAEAALARGDSAAATAALRPGSDAAARLHAAPLRDALAALARRARIELPGESGPGSRAAGHGGDAPFGLTPREHDVLVLLAEGRTNRQIAGQLFISESTAGVHVSNILGKLEVATRTEAAAVAIRLGIVPGARDA